MLEDDTVLCVSFADVSRLHWRWTARFTETSAKQFSTSVITTTTHKWKHNTACCAKTVQTRLFPQQKETYPLLQQWHLRTKLFYILLSSMGLQNSS